MNRIEALADSFAALNDWHDPESEAYGLRNPGLLRAFTLKHASNEQSHRIFPSAIDGYQALLFDLRTKCSGKSRSKLLTSSTLEDLLSRGYSQPRSAVDFVLCFLARALPKNTITERTPLAFFLEDIQ
jgi:hypothetical protein